MFVETNPAPIKHVLARGGLIGSGYVRPPLVEPTPARRRRDRPPHRRGWRPACTSRSTGWRACSLERAGERHHLRRPQRQGAGRRAVGDAPLHRRRARRQRRRRRARRARSRHPHRATPPSPPARRPTSTAPWPPPRQAFEQSGWAEHAEPQALRDAARDRRRDRGARRHRSARFEAFDTGLPVTPGARARPRGRPRTSATSPTCARSMHEDAFRTKAQLGYVIRRPRGVAGLITPWNVPFMLATWKIAPCLAAGLHGRAQAGRAGPAVGQLAAGDHGGGGGSGRACSTSSTASARRPARRSSPTPTCP